MAILRRGCGGVVVTALLAFGAQPLSAGPDADELAERYTAWILDEIPQYRDHRRSRALAGCVDWSSATAGYLRVTNLVWYYLDPTLGGWSMMPSQLMNQAMGLCAQQRADDASCQCERIARKNDTVLEIPSEVLARLATPDNDAKVGEDISGDDYTTNYDTEWFAGSALTEVDFARLQPHGQAPLVPATKVTLFTDAVFVVLGWDLGLRADASYALRYRLVDPDGNTQDRHEEEIYPSFHGGRSWHRFLIKNEVKRPGLWRVAIDVDGRTVAERPLPIQAKP